MIISDLLKKVPMFSYSEISANEARSQGREAFNELITSIAINALAYSFMEGPNALFGVSLRVLASNAFNFIKIKRAFYLSNKKIKIIQEQNWLSSCFFNICSANWIMILFHELGHFLALKAVYQDIHPSIHLSPLGEGRTEPNYCFILFHPFYTDLGERLGADGREIVHTAGGPFFTFLGASSCLILSRIIKNSKISSHLKWTSYLTFFDAFMYVGTSLYHSPSTSDHKAGHDFVSLRGYGLNLLVPAIIYAATPFFLHFSMNAIESCFAKKRDVVIVRPNSICEKIRNLWLAIVASILVIGGVIQIYTWRKT